MRIKSSSNTLCGIGITLLVGAVPITMFLIMILGIIGVASGSAFLTGSFIVICFAICLSLFTVGGVLAYHGYKKRTEAEYLWYSINATERDYYYNLVNNSNYVKRVDK